MKLAIARGTVVSPAGIRRRTLLCEHGKIVSIHGPEDQVDADTQIDASGLLIFPGFIDPHVHSREPGQTDKEDFTHSTQAAAVGGITCLFEMPNAIPPLRDAATYMERERLFAGKAFVDFGLWGMVHDLAALNEIPSLFAAGVVGVKVFWGYALDRRTGALSYAAGRDEQTIPPPDDGAVLEIFRSVAKAGGLVAAHCENRAILEVAAQRTPPDTNTYANFLSKRPGVAEAATIALGAEFALETGCAFHVVHVSSARGVEIIRQRQREGIRISAETCPHYLTLTDASYQQVGSAMKVYPPIRTQADQDALWAAVNDGTISSIGSDHAPHTLAERSGDFDGQPAGATGIETMAQLLLDEARRGRTSLQRLAWIMSEGTARNYGVYPRKGVIEPGSDADFTLVDPEREWVIDNRRLHSKNPLSPWQGRPGRGVPTMTILRGEIIAKDGEIVGPPRGALLRRQAKDV